MTREAQNALLKTIEEPLPEVYFFILMPHLYGLLPTLLSRVAILKRESEAVGGEGATSVKIFLSALPKERLKMLAPLTKKYEEHEKRQEQKQEALSFLNKIEIVLEASLPESFESLEKVARVKKYLYVESAHVGLILDHLAFVL